MTAGATALGAWGGAAGLATGTLRLGAGLTERLPFASPVFGGMALVAVVALPFSVLAVWAWRADRRTGIGSAAAGILLMGWIAVELAFVRSVSFLQPFYFLLGAVFVVVGRHDMLRLIHRSDKPR